MSEIGCLAVLIGTPMVRVGWLTVAWVRIRDRRSALLGAGLLLVLLTSAVVAFT